MTIGPEPRTRILARSSRLGMGREAVDELVEQAQRVVRAWPCLRVVLDAAGGDVEQPDTLDRPVVEVHVRELGGAERGLDPLAGLPLHREAVVLRRDRDPPRA